MGPVEIGMSLDIASIDAISEINMVIFSFMFFSFIKILKTFFHKIRNRH